MVAHRLYRAEELAKIFKIDPVDVHSYLLHHNMSFFKDGDRYEISEWDFKEWDKKREKKRIAREGTENQKE